ncbi:hypothetical protein H2200_001351 [Cladophialophora chaetospira]|uniref:Uncharacterized protein n=1 Tax=Cladophialophora chaetospira TaxID=386627 RepID=A0AA38XKS7_9EURO|nr:hypothetical protein H2200_001351 [Cladophialophora chaetospira]
MHHQEAVDGEPATSLELLGRSGKRLLELYLIYHYITVVAPSFPSESGTSLPIYSHQAGRLSFEHDCLLNAILAVSSLHIAQEVAPDHIPFTIRRHDFKNLHQVYLQCALSHQRQALPSLSAATIEALALTSILLSIAALRLGASSPAIPYRPPTSYLQLSLGIRTIITTAQTLSPLPPILSHLLFADNISYRLDSHDVAALYDPSNIPPKFLPILTFNASHLSPSDPTSNSTFIPTLSLLSSIHLAFTRGEPPYQLSRRITSFASLAPPLFLSLLTAAHPCALVIFAHYIAMTVPLVEHYWFYRDVAQNEITGIDSILPEDWKWALSWPRKTCERCVVD